MYWCRDYCCCRVTAQLQLVVVVVVVVVAVVVVVVVVVVVEGVVVVVVFSSYIPSASSLVYELCVTYYKNFIYYFFQIHEFYYSPLIREQRPEFYLKIRFISQSLPSTCLPIQHSHPTS